MTKKIPAASPNCCAVLLCGGEGSRLASQGIDTHKPLMPIHDKPSLLHVVDQMKSLEIEFNSIIVVVPDSRIVEYQQALHSRDCLIVAQPKALGTGDAVCCAIPHIPEATEHVYVSFGTQPLITNTTIETSLSFHIDNALGFTLPTTFTANPYAPLSRDEDGKVSDSLETHLEGVKKPEFGEANVGGYWVDVKTLAEVLVPLQKKKWDSGEGRYDTPSGELGFPNEMVRGCLSSGHRVDGIPCSKPEEMLGLKRLEDIAVIESEFSRRRRSNIG